MSNTLGQIGKAVLLILTLTAVSCQSKQSEVATATAGDDPIATQAGGSVQEYGDAGSAMDSKEHKQNVENPAGPASAAGKALLPSLRKGMTYADFRKAVVDAGWEPVVNPECRANVVGGDHESFCSGDSTDIGCRICDVLPELDASSGDGYSLVRFRHPKDGELLEATGYGMIEDWNVGGEESRLQVTGWEFQAPPPK